MGSRNESLAVKDQMQWALYALNNPDLLLRQIIERIHQLIDLLLQFGGVGIGVLCLRGIGN